jgi:hypothetical protein
MRVRYQIVGEVVATFEAFFGAFELGTLYVAVVEFPFEIRYDAVRFGVGRVAPSVFKRIVVLRGLFIVAEGFVVVVEGEPVVIRIAVLFHAASACNQKTFGIAEQRLISYLRGLGTVHRRTDVPVASGRQGAHNAGGVDRKYWDRWWR